MKNYISLDLETTGVDSNSDSIIEVGAVRFDENGTVLKEFETYIQPGISIPAFITNLTGISNDDVRHAPDFSEIRDDFIRFIGTSPIIGHNVDFDLAFLRTADVHTKCPVFDTWILATILLPHLASHSLEVLVRELKLPLDTAHRAMADAKSTMHLFLQLRSLIDKLPQESLQAIQAALSGQRWDLAELFRAPKTVKSFSIDDLLPEQSIIEDSPEENVKYSIAAVEKQFHALAKDATPAFQHIELREGQVEMASIIAEALEHGGFHIIEGGAGIGKSFAYLLPALQFSKAHEKQIVVSTYTNNLQDQLFSKDIALLREFLPFSFQASVLKGRSHYLCTKRFGEFVQMRHNDRFALSLLVKLLLWFRTTSDGDTSTLRLVYQEQSILQTLVASKYNCRGTSCEGSGAHECFYKRARNRAKKSDLVIINHALLLSDHDQHDSLHYEHLIVDEAHHLEDALTSHFSTSRTLHDFDEISRPFHAWHKNALKLFSSAAFIHSEVMMRELQEQIVLFFGIAQLFFQKQQRQQQRAESTLTIGTDYTDTLEWQQVASAFQTLTTKKERLFEDCKDLKEQIRTKGSAKKTKSKKHQRVLEEWQRIQGEIEEYFLALSSFCIDQQKRTVYWLEQRIRPYEELVFHSAPLSVHENFHEHVLSHLETCVLTSATLTTAESFDYTRERLDLDSSWQEHSFPSPYDYASCVSAVIPSDIALPNHPLYSKHLHSLLLDAALSFSGHTLVLFASFEALKKAYSALQKPLQQQGISIFAQQMSGGRHKVVEMFKHHPRSVLFGTRSFWEGIDLAGCNLSCVVIAKLPFPVPTDPLLSARGEEYDNSFAQLCIPQALLLFRQGFGRLIRSSSDKGVVIIADRRVVHSSYGTHFIQSLPPIDVQMTSLANMREQLSEHARRCG